jgi:AI-2 transport protein TqsA
MRPRGRCRGRRAWRTGSRADALPRPPAIPETRREPAPRRAVHRPGRSLQGTSDVQNPTLPGLDRSGPPLVSTAAFVIVVIGLYLASGIVSLLLLSILVAILVAPITAWAQRRGWPGWAGLLLALASYVGVLVIVGLITAIGVIRLLAELPTDTTELQTQLGTNFGDPAVAKTIADAFGEIAASAARSVLSALALIGYSVIIVAYLLVEQPTIGTRLRWAFGDRPAVTSRAVSIAVRLRSYLIARAVLGGIAAILDTIVLVALGIPSALLWGVLSFLMSFVPNVGFIISMIPPALLGLVVGGLPTAILVVIAYSVINVAIDYLVQPRFIGSAVDLSPVVVTVSLLFWALVLGGAGAIFAVPLTIILVGVADSFDGTRPLSRMLAANVPALLGEVTTTADAAAPAAPSDEPEPASDAGSAG